MGFISLFSLISRLSCKFLFQLCNFLIFSCCCSLLLVQFSFNFTSLFFLLLSCLSFLVVVSLFSFFYRFLSILMVFYRLLLLIFHNFLGSMSCFVYFERFYIELFSICCSIPCCTYFRRPTPPPPILAALFLENCSNCQQLFQ